MVNNKKILTFKTNLPHSTPVEHKNEANETVFLLSLTSVRCRQDLLLWTDPKPINVAYPGFVQSINHCYQKTLFPKKKTKSLFRPLHDPISAARKLSAQRSWSTVGHSVAVHWMSRPLSYSGGPGFRSSSQNGYYE